MQPPRKPFLLLGSLAAVLASAGCGDGQPAKKGGAESLDPRRVLSDKYSRGGARAAIAFHVAERLDAAEARRKSLKPPATAVDGKVEEVLRAVDLLMTKRDGSVASGEAGAVALSEEEQHELAEMEKELERLQLQQSRLRAASVSESETMSAETARLNEMKRELDTGRREFWKVVSHRLDPVADGKPGARRSSTMEIALTDYQDLFGGKSLTFRLTWEPIDHPQVGEIGKIGGSYAAADWELRTVRTLGDWRKSSSDGAEEE